MEDGRGVFVFFVVTVLQNDRKRKEASYIPCWLVVWNMKIIFHILGIVTPTD
jgi:hypothetical protein